MKKCSVFALMAVLLFTLQQAAYASKNDGADVVVTTVDWAACDSVYFHTESFFCIYSGERAYLLTGGDERCSY